jgi:tetratricopeptide (TPR) repeat protein
MRRQSLLTNRVILGMLAFFIVVAFWTFRVRQQYQPLYKEGVVDYQKGQYSDALEKFTRAYSISPNAQDVILMMGWTNLKLRRFEEAGYYFNRALSIDPKTEEARLGAGFVALETGRGTMDLTVLQSLLERRRNDPSVKLLVAGALVRLGRHMEASALFKELRDDKDYGKAAQAALDDMFGLLGFNDPIPDRLAPLSKPAQTQVRFRASEGAIWRQSGAGMEKFYVAGVNLGPAAPGFYPGAPPTRGDTYADWLRLARQMNANVVRVYGLMPPGFYRAFRHQRDEGSKLTLYQQIPVDPPPGNDLYDPKFTEDTKAEIRYVVDALHGRGEVPPQPGKASGVYENDIAAQVSGLLFGREIDPVVATQTNLSNPSKKSSTGKYVSVSDATPTQVWVAGMLDYLVGYETDTYNAQHPVAMVNWPQLDPLFHSSESGRINSLAIDEAKFRVTPEFQAGLFVSYQVYQDRPTFMVHEPRYVNARDSEGPNPLVAYLRDLRAHIPYPLVVSEYGASNSIGVLDFLPSWSHGGHSEEEQAQILGRLTRTVRDAGCAGGVVFELIDEWYGIERVYSNFENPRDRATLWINELDPQKRYGLVGYRTSKWRLFAGDTAGWQAAQVLYSGSGAVRSVRAASDEAFLYLRLEAPCPDCATRPGVRPPAEATGYVIAINTAPSLVGLEKLPFGNLTVSGGANFLIYLGDPASARLRVAANYNPFDVAADGKLTQKTGFVPSLLKEGTFQQLAFPLERHRRGPGGVSLPEEQSFVLSGLRYGNGDPGSNDFDSLAEWFYDAKDKAILLRIPWGKLLVTDPSSLHVFYGFDDAGVTKSVPSSGVSVSVFAVKGASGGDWSSLSVSESFPPASGGSIGRAERLAWSKWDAVHPDTYLKRAYHDVQKDFADLSRPQAAAGGGRTGAGAGRGRPGTGGGTQ